MLGGAWRTGKKNWNIFVTLQFGNLLLAGFWQAIMTIRVTWFSSLKFQCFPEHILSFRVAWRAFRIPEFWNQQLKTLKIKRLEGSFLNFLPGKGGFFFGDVGWGLHLLVSRGDFVVGPLRTPMSWKSKLLGRMSTQLVACTLDELLGGMCGYMCVFCHTSVFEKMGRYKAWRHMSSTRSAVWFNLFFRGEERSNNFKARKKTQKVGEFL